MINLIDEYISKCPESVQSQLNELRNIIKEVAPQSVEKISYGMPAFYLYGNLVYFGICKNHIGFYPTASPIIHFQDELKDFETSKGSIHLPLNKPLPIHLIKKIVSFRIDENTAKYLEKQKK